MPAHGRSKYLGQHSGKLTVIDTTYVPCRITPGHRPTYGSRVVCRCDCGRSVILAVRSFRAGYHRSCQQCDQATTKQADAARLHTEEAQRERERQHHERQRLAALPRYQRREADLIPAADTWMR